MKINKVILTNFRGYSNPTEIYFNDLTVFVGRNDIGKSTVLEALDLFFNEGKGAIKFDKADISVGADNKEYEIAVVFADLPTEVIVDSTYKTTLENEYLLNKDGNLHVIKKFSSGTKFKGTYIRALHPTNPECDDLLQKKVSELRAIIKKEDIDCERQTTNAVMRQAIWKKHSDNLQLAVKDIDVAVGDDAKRIWAKLSEILPAYSLFQSDRQNTDGDKEIQDPLKAAVGQFFLDEKIQVKLNEVASEVEEKLREVSNRTLEKLREMDPAVADTLSPVIPSPTQLKWSDVFKNVSITADDDIPINKRGSGVKRLILLNFFRAEAERRQKDNHNTGLIYAIEEPETSQHFSNQKILAEALISLSKTQNTQVILTTHSGVVVKMLDFKDLRLISKDTDEKKTVTHVEKGILGYPSMNEVNYTSFDEITEEYHDELYGFISSHNWLSDYENGKKRIPYLREKDNGTIIEQNLTETKYIRHVIHHPENTHNDGYTFEMIKQSVENMRTFIAEKTEGTEVWSDKDDFDS